MSFRKIENTIYDYVVLVFIDTFIIVQASNCINIHCPSNIFVKRPETAGDGWRRPQTAGKHPQPRVDADARAHMHTDARANVHRGLHTHTRAHSH